MSDPVELLNLCIYCQEVEATTRDHVPGDGLFPSPKPDNLITVPACKNCNAGFQKDDDYFKLLSMAEMAGNNPSAQVVREKTRRSLDRPQARGFQTELRRRTEIAEVVSNQGLYIGKTSLLSIDRERLRGIIRRYARGLFYHETGRTLPKDVEFEAHFIGELEADTEIFPKLSQNILSHADSAPTKSLGDVFAYSVKFFEEDVNAAVWKLKFYDSFIFYAWTFSKPLYNNLNDTGSRLVANRSS